MSSAADFPYKKEPVDLEIARSMEDYELTTRVFTNVVLSLDTKLHNRKDQLVQRTPQERTLYYASLLDMQVLNGGIHQYFGNYKNQYDIEVIQALRDLGRADVAERFTQIPRIAGHEFEEVEDSFKEFDSFYYACDKSKSMNAYFKEYIVSHISIFQL